jgi:hypothetical protein
VATVIAKAWTIPGGQEVAAAWVPPWQSEAITPKTAVKPVQIETVDSNLGADAGLDAKVVGDEGRTLDEVLVERVGIRQEVVAQGNSTVVAADLGDMMVTVDLTEREAAVPDWGSVVDSGKMIHVGFGEWKAVPMGGRVPCGTRHDVYRAGKMSAAIGGMGCYCGFYATLDDEAGTAYVSGNERTGSGESSEEEYREGGCQDQHCSGDSAPKAGERPRVRVSSRAGGDGSNPYSHTFDRGWWSSAYRFQRTARCDELKEKLRSHLAKLQWYRQSGRVCFLRLLRIQSCAFEVSPDGPISVGTCGMHGPSSGAELGELTPLQIRQRLASGGRRLRGAKSLSRRGSAA